MTQDQATGEAAFFGLVGFAIISVGGVVASGLVGWLGVWLGGLPALVVTAIAVFYGTKQFAHGIYAVVDDASSG